jgi:hypothetical protein
MFKLNVESLKAQIRDIESRAEKRAAGTSNDAPKANYINVPSGREVVLYLLPPWSEAGQLGKVQHAVYLAPIARRHTSWESISPELKYKDPVEEVLGRAIKAGHSFRDIAKRTTKTYANVVLVASGDVGKPKPISPIEVGVIGFTTGVWAEILRAVAEDPSILDATTASPFRLSRTGSGVDTEWKVSQCGTVTPDGFTAHRSKVLDKYGEIAQAWAAPLNLDTIWYHSQLVEDTSKNTADLLAAKLGLPRVGTPA